MKLRQIISLVAILGVGACNKEEEEYDFEEDTHFSEDVEASLEPTLLRCRETVRPECYFPVVGASLEPTPFPSRETVRPECYFSVPAIALEDALNTLYTDGGRAKVVERIVDKLGFEGWVEATGGRLFGCTGDHVPLHRERIVAAIDHYRKTKQFERAVELAEDAQLVTHDSKAFGNIRALALEGARDSTLSPEVRIDLYTRASEHGNKSYEENGRLAEEVVSYFSSVGQSLPGQVIVEKLLPDQVGYEHEDGRKEQLTIPPSIKAKRDELLARLERHSSDSSKRLDVPELNYPRYDPGKPCESLAAEIKRGSITHLEEAVRSASCSPTLILRGYETRGRFEEARIFAETNGLKKLARAYQVVQDAMQY